MAIKHLNIRLADDRSAYIIAGWGADFVEQALYVATDSESLRQCVEKLLPLEPALRCLACEQAGPHSHIPAEPPDAGFPFY
jgi:hypothetical protein